MVAWGLGGALVLPCDEAVYVRYGRHFDSSGRYCRGHLLNSKWPLQ